MTTNIDSHNPVSGEVVWSGPISTPTKVEQAIHLAHHQLASWRTTKLADRVDLVPNYASYLKKNADEVADLMCWEVGKLRWDSSGEVAAAIAKAELSIQALQQRRSKLVAGDGNSPQRTVRYAPIGVALVLGPYNFPLHLPGGQIIPALLAGNTVVFKPSDQATAVGQWMLEAWRRVGLPEHVLQLIVGGVETAITAIESPKINGVYLTGGLEAGRAIHRQLAGRPEVLLALELGGNNPVVVMPDADPQGVANNLSFSAFISTGQRFTCARRAKFVEGDSTSQQIEALVKITNQLRVGLPGDQPVPHLGPLISSAAAEKIESTYKQLQQLGCHPILPWQSDRQADCLAHPAILEAVDLDDDARRMIGEMEWFGPLLVIERFPNFEAACQAAADTPYGLAASLLGGSAELFEQFVNQVGAGVVNWNGPTTGAAGVLPFGGLGASGNHRPAGFHAIDFCSDPIASLQRTEFTDGDPWSVAK
ncbi:MAG: aldehyde dehydrogenase family protein [Planctomycetota bacterium]|nr:aldehyde dehydrogenase family protein [Planctomycetota bacterium]